MLAPTQLQSPNTAQTLSQAPVPQADQERRRQMKQAWKSYRGEFQPPLKVEKDQPDDNVLVNKMRGIVDALVSSLFGKPVEIEATDEATDDDDTPAQPAPPPTPAKPGEPIPFPKPVKPKKPKATPLQDYIDGLWGDDDDKMTLLTKAAINGGVCGQSFLKLIPPRFGMKYPRIVVLDPSIVRIAAHPEDCDLHLAYIIEYATSDKWEKRQIIARVDPNNSLETVGDDDVLDTWTITTYMRPTTGNGMTQNTWIQVGASEDWLYPFAPIFTCPNLPNPNESWGVPNLTPDLIAENNTLNFLYSNLARIIKYHGHPKTWAAGTNAANISVAVDGVLCFPSPDSKLEALAAMENFAGILSVIASVMANIDEESRVPSVALGRLADLPKGNISGVALQLLFQPLISKVTQMQRLYGKMIREITKAALVMAGLVPMENYEDCEIELKWQSLLPADDTAAAQTAMLYKQLGISDDTILSMLGFDPDDEMAKSANEDAQKMTLYSRGQGFPVAPPTPPTPGVPVPGQQPQQQANQNAQQGQPVGAGVK